MGGKEFKESPTTGKQRRRLYPVEDAAFELGISDRKCWTLIYAGRLRTKRLDGRRLVPADALDEFVASLPDSEESEAEVAS